VITNHEITIYNYNHCYEEEFLNNIGFSIAPEIGGPKRVKKLLKLIKNQNFKHLSRAHVHDQPASLPVQHVALMDELIEDELVLVNANKMHVQSSEHITTIVASSYHTNCLGHEIICDKSCARRFNKGSLLVITTADGCGWGHSSSEAALYAISHGDNYFSQELLRTKLLVADLRIQDIAHSMQVAASFIEQELINRKSLSGTTTYLQTVVSKRADENKFDIVVYSIGDMKVFLYRPSTHAIVDITAINSRNGDPTDPGGRLGKFPKKSDLRNASLFHHPALKGDIIIQISDGIYDCLSPETLNISGEETSRFIEKALLALLNDSPCELQTIAHRLINHSMALTTPARLFLEENERCTLPNDHSQFPGKPDHVLVTVARIGIN
jgi:serine/threonine protein phosphatase PrpC